MIAHFNWGDCHYSHYRGYLFLEANLAVLLWQRFSTICLCFCCTFLCREAVRSAVETTSFSVITTCASPWSGSVMAKRTARWERMKETAREQVQNKTSPICTRNRRMISLSTYWNINKLKKNLKWVKDDEVIKECNELQTLNLYWRVNTDKGRLNV